MHCTHTNIQYNKSILYIDIKMIGHIYRPLFDSTTI